MNRAAFTHPRTVPVGAFAQTLSQAFETLQNRSPIWFVTVIAYHIIPLQHARINRNLEDAMQLGEGPVVNLGFDPGTGELPS